MGTPAPTPDGYFWGSCRREDDWYASKHRHLIRIGGIDTRCACTASLPEVWEAGHPKTQCPECVATMTPAELNRPKAKRAHALTVEWNGERGEESSSTGTCRCGWEESASNQREVRFEYREHLKSVKRAAAKTS